MKVVTTAQIDQIKPQFDQTEAKHGQLKKKVIG